MSWRPANGVPYHCEYGRQEWVVVVAGLLTLRAADGEHQLRSGDVVAFVEGPDGAHQILNESDEAARFVMFSTKERPNAYIYPDSGKLAVAPGWSADPTRI